MIFKHSSHLEFDLRIGNKLYTLGLNDSLLMTLLIIGIHGQESPWRRKIGFEWDSLFC